MRLPCCLFGQHAVCSVLIIVIFVRRIGYDISCCPLVLLPIAAVGECTGTHSHTQFSYGHTRLQGPSSDFLLLDLASWQDFDLLHRSGRIIAAAVAAATQQEKLLGNKSIQCQCNISIIVSWMGNTFSLLRRPSGTGCSIGEESNIGLLAAWRSAFLHPCSPNVFASLPLLSQHA